MRLINTVTFERCELSEIQHAAGYETPIRYAILSHRWLATELSYATYSADLLKSSDTAPHITKIRGACQIAAAETDPLQWIWIDNVCIDKSSSTELSEAINSMFAWCRDAEICYAYLRDTHGSIYCSSGQPSEWFSRGWTLQELIAPTKMCFYDASWTALGTRTQLAPVIESATRIAAKYLNGRESFRSASIAARLSWQASRHTTRVEDMTYSLLGVLDLSLDIRYGEGPAAFLRLQALLLRNMSVSDESLFAWTTPPEGLPARSHGNTWGPDEWGLLAPSPQCYADSADIVIGRKYRRRPPNAYYQTGEGVIFQMPEREIWASRHEGIKTLGLLLMYTMIISHPIAYTLHYRQKEFRIALNCWRKDKAGILRPVQLILTRDDPASDKIWRRGRCSCLELSDDTTNATLRSDKTTKEVTILQPSHLIWERNK